MGCILVSSLVNMFIDVPKYSAYNKDLVSGSIHI